MRQVADAVEDCFCISRAWQEKILNKSINTALPETHSASAHSCLLQGWKAAGEALHNAAHGEAVGTRGGWAQGTNGPLLFIQKVTFILNWVN